MKLIEARKIGSYCGLKTDAECIANIELHCCNLFEYGEVEKELKELKDDTISQGVNYNSIMSEYWKIFNSKISNARGTTK